MRATHIVPLSVGDYEYARLMGQDWITEYILFELIWGPKNGLLLHSKLERYLDDGSFVIVPVSNEPEKDEYKLVVLYEDRKKEKIDCVEDEHGEIKEVTPGDLDGQTLKWLNNHRPTATNLYIRYLRYLMTRLVRRRALAQGWQVDTVKVPPGRAWTDIEPLRHSMLRVLCEEIGDFAGEKVQSLFDEQKDVPTIGETVEEALKSHMTTMVMARNFSDELEKVGPFDSE